MIVLVHFCWWIFLNLSFFFPPQTAQSISQAPIFKFLCSLTMLTHECIYFVCPCFIRYLEWAAAEREQSAPLLDNEEEEAGPVPAVCCVRTQRQTGAYPFSYVCTRNKQSWETEWSSLVQFVILFLTEQVKMTCLNPAWTAAKPERWLYSLHIQLKLASVFKLKSLRFHGNYTFLEMI